MKKISIISFLLLSFSAFTQTYISERLVTTYHVEGIAAKHTQVARDFINEKLRDFDCLEIKLDQRITKEAKFRLFSNNIPGNYQLDMNTKCYSPELSRVRFAIDGFGYDEDYTVIDLEVSVRGEKYTYQTCAYGGESVATKCPSFLDSVEQNFSTQLAN